MNAICYSVNLNELVFLSEGGGDNSTLHVVIRLIWTFCTQR